MQGTIRQLENKADELKSEVVPQIEDAAKRLGDLNSRIVAFVREHPGSCLLGALALGFIVGKIAARR